MPERQKVIDNGDKIEPEPGSVREALEAINASEEFAASPRLKEILTYVVEEKLAGRSDQIKGKTIAADVYGRDLETAAPTDNIVRVEARRLRRVLGQFYEGSGKKAPVRIHIDAGSYVPRFEISDCEDKPTSKIPPSPEKQTPWFAAIWPSDHGAIAAISSLAIFVLLGGYLFYHAERINEATATEPARAQSATRAALMEKSPLAVQSMNMSDQARGLLFPVFDLERQKLAITLFERAIDLDGTLPDGYAGKAQALATLAFLSPDPTVSGDLLKQAQGLATKALEVGPTSARSHGAIAWIKSFSGEHGAARKHADIAVDLMPNDGYILDIDGVVAILSGDGVRAASASDPGRTRIGDGRFGAPNIWGVANYMLGNHQAVVQAFKEAPASGAPVSAPSLVFLAASLDHIGQHSEAKSVVKKLKASWPDFPVRFVLHRLFGETETATDIFQRLHKNGLNDAPNPEPKSSRS